MLRGGLLLVPEESFFCSLGRKRAYYAVLAHFRHFSSNMDYKKERKLKIQKFENKIKKSKDVKKKIWTNQ